MKSKKLFAIIGVCAVLVAAVVGIFIVKGQRDNAQAPATESSTQAETQATEVAQTQTETTAPPPRATQEQLDKVVYSSQVGEVNGTTYSVIDVGTVLDDYGGYTKASETPVISRLPVDYEGYITSFACHEGYVYYVVTEDDKWCETYSLYRCNSNFGEKELLLKNDMGYKEGFTDIGWDFVIDNGKLYATSYEITDEITKFQCVDLETKEITYESRTDYRGLDGVMPDESVMVYDGKVFANDKNYGSHPDKVIGYQLTDGKRVAMKDDALPDDSASVCISGFADGWIYYYVGGPFVDGANNYLKRYKLSDGTIEVVDKRGLGGSTNFFQKYNVEEI